jgi:hypothetical protein
MAEIIYGTAGLYEPPRTTIVPISHRLREKKVYFVERQRFQSAAKIETRTE